ncbi:MAG: MBL fold metallo-hydrolase [Chloroflexi bacterium]|nr:MBL fold metallo-hydrolase [Chloroflexota bacterium]
MQLQLIRNATLRLQYAGRTFLMDPFLAAKYTRPSFAGKSPNPLVELPCSPQEVIAGIEMVVISHLHSDHFDPAAQELLPKELPIFCQPGDEAAIRARGFSQVTPVQDSIIWQGITMTRTPGRHGTGAVLAEMGQVSGFVFQADKEPTVYEAGDTVWYEAVGQVIARMRPEVIITHSAGAVWQEYGLIVMDAEQTVAVCRAAPQSTVVAIHLDSLDHGTISRAALRAYADAAGIRREQLLIPADGEKLVF